MNASPSCHFFSLHLFPSHLRLQEAINHMYLTPRMGTQLSHREVRFVKSIHWSNVGDRYILTPSCFNLQKEVSSDTDRDTKTYNQEEQAPTKCMESQTVIPMDIKQSDYACRQVDLLQFGDLLMFLVEMGLCLCLTRATTSHRGS